MEDIGKRIRELRKMAGMTQQELADAIGRTKSSVKKYEAGQVAVSVKLAEKMAEVFGVSTFDILQDRRPTTWFMCDGRREGCKRRSCFRNGGDCYHTKDPEHAINFTTLENGDLRELNPYVRWEGR